MRFTHIQNSFLSGRLSSRAHGRTETKNYADGVKELKNFIANSQGGATRRAGTEYIKDSTFLNSDNKACRIIPFVFSKNETYAVMIYAYTGTDIRDGGITATVAHQIEIYNISSGVTSHLNEMIDISAGSRLTGYNGTDSGTFRPSYSQLNQVQYSQSGDVMILVHPMYNPIAIIRYGENNFRLTHFQNAFVAASIGGATPFLDQNADATKTITSSATSGGTTLTASFDFFRSGHKGAIIRLDSGAVTGFCVITAVTSNTVASATIITAFDSGVTSGVSTWFESAWSDYQGWPRTVAFYDNRVVYGGSIQNPNMLVFSELNDFSELMEQAALGSTQDLDTCPWIEYLTSDGIDEIQWILSGKSLTIGTAGCEIIGFGPNNQLAIGIENKKFETVTSHGSEFVQAKRIGNAACFVARGGEKIRELNFNFDEDNYRAEHLNFLSEDLARLGEGERSTFAVPTFVSMHYQEMRNSIIWLLDNNGCLSGISRDKSTVSSAAHIHRLGGDLTGETPFVESMASVPASNGNFDDVWLCVRRTINGQAKYTIERIINEYELNTIENDSSDIRNKPAYSDGFSYQRHSSAQTDFGGLTHLVGETVQVLADSKYVGTTEVQEGDQYITNQGAETDLTGWYHYTDAISGSATVNTTTNVITLSGHKFRDEMIIRYSSAGAIGGLSSGGAYRIKNANISAGTFQLSDPNGNTPVVDLTSNPGGTHTFTPVMEPVSGAEAAGPLSFTKNLSSPLVGTADFLLTKDASSREGTGVSANFTINTADRGKPVRVSFVWSKTGFGSLSENVIFTVSVFDRTNAVICPPIGARDFFSTYSNPVDTYVNVARFGANTGSSTSPNEFSCDFLTNSNSTDYRLCIHIRTNTSSAGTLNFDSVSVDGTGYVELEDSATEAIIGLQYDSVIKSLDLEAGSSLGSAQGGRRRINKTTVRLHKTVGGKIGRDENNLYPLVFRHQNDITDNPIELFTGDKITEFKGDTGSSAEWCIKQDIPLPMTVCAVVSRGESND